MEVKILEKIPLLKIKNKNTESRILRIYGNRSCVIYSELEKGYKKGDTWIEDHNAADILTFNEWYEKTSDKKSDGIVYCVIKI